MKLLSLAFLGLVACSLGACSRGDIYAGYDSGGRSGHAPRSHAGGLPPNAFILPGPPPSGAMGMADDDDEDGRPVRMAGRYDDEDRGPRGRSGKPRCKSGTYVEEYGKCFTPGDLTDEQKAILAGCKNIEKKVVRGRLLQRCSD